MGGGHHDAHAAAPAKAGSAGPPEGLHYDSAIKVGSPLIMDVKKGLWYGTLFSAGASLSTCPSEKNRGPLFVVVVVVAAVVWVCDAVTASVVPVWYFWH